MKSKTIKDGVLVYKVSPKRPSRIISREWINGVNPQDTKDVAYNMGFNPYYAPECNMYSTLDYNATKQRVIYTVSLDCDC